jgi:hypothetical protein
MRRAEAVDIGGLVIRAGKRRAVAEQIEIAWGVRTGKGPGGQRCMVAPGRRGFDPRLALPVNASNEGRVGKRACFKKKLLGEFGENGEHSGVVLAGGGKPEKVRATAHRKEGPLVRDVWTDHRKEGPLVRDVWTDHRKEGPLVRDVWIFSALFVCASAFEVGFLKKSVW